MRQRREGWATRKFNCVRLGSMEGLATRPGDAVRAYCRNRELDTVPV